MENEEKKGCCENKEGASCCHGMAGCSHNWKKCHMMRKIVWIIILVIIFCLGTQYGEMKGGRRGGNRFEKGGMMNWGYGKFENKNLVNPEKATGEVTVDVSKVAPTATQ